MRTFDIAAMVGTILVIASPAAAQDWRGPYIGLSVGGAFVDDDDDERVLFDTNLDGGFGDTVRNVAMVDAFGPTTANPGGFCGGKARANNFASGCSDEDDVGGDFALRAGWDFQTGSWVYGGVVEIASVEVEDSATAFSITPAAYQFQRELDDVLYAARLRGGRIWGGSLIYVTGGVATAKVVDSYATTNTANSFTPVTSEDDATGYQVGAGAEAWLTDRLTVGVEYLYTNLDAGDGLTVRTGRGTAPTTNPFLIVNPQGTDQRRMADELAFQSVRVTVTARF